MTEINNSFMSNVLTRGMLLSISALKTFHADESPLPQSISRPSFPPRMDDLLEFIKISNK